ncbi:MAG TPA: DUF1127 domain-containing protein [Paracoccus sp. (in: a-proteobacteria)]|nr:DUF1127 domain-containing protein [Paracoccus sp. (in: a-proteobacteria)]
MSAIDFDRAPVGVHANGIGTRLRATITRWADTRATRNELSRLTDRELDDIGLCRGDIERVARGL